MPACILRPVIRLEDRIDVRSGLSITFTVREFYGLHFTAPWGGGYQQSIMYCWKNRLAELRVRYINNVHYSSQIIDISDNLTKLKQF